MSEIFPNGFTINITDPIILVINLLFSVWVVYSIIKYQKKGHKLRSMLYVIVLLWNLLNICLGLFTVTLPISNGMLTYVSYGVWGAVILEWIYTSKNEKKKVSS